MGHVHPETMRELEQELTEARQGILECQTRILALQNVLESIALVTAYTEPLPGSLAGHVKVLVDNLLALERELAEANKAYSLMCDEEARLGRCLDEAHAAIRAFKGRHDGDERWIYEHHDTHCDLCRKHTPVIRRAMGEK